jgi:predicted dehydrogenase
MKKRESMLIVGFGSIGKRHYKNLLTLGVKKENLFVLDPHPKTTSMLSRKNILRREATVSWNDYKIVLICSPSSMHVQHALIAAKAGCHLFIEKPLSHSMQGVEKLARTVRQKKIVTMVACNMRFHPCLKKLKSLLEKKAVGKVYAIHHEAAFYLPYWKPGTDYKKSYSASKKMGGGAILDGIHEFDLLFWLNGYSDIARFYIIKDTVGNLNIETEDMYVASFQFKNKVLGSVRGDYLQRHYSRTCKIIGEKGNLEWNFDQNIIWLSTRDTRKKIFAIKQYDSNAMYIDELRYFLSCTQKRKSVCNDVPTAATLLKHLV